MFPTRSKSKIPSSLTYPLKAKAISEALADVPQAEELQMYFSNYRTPSELRKQTKYSLIQVGYRHREIDQFTPHYFEESGFHDPKWSIDVYAVPVEIGARVMQLLQDEALPKIRAWLNAKTDMVNQRSCSIQVFYNEPDDELEYRKDEN